MAPTPPLTDKAIRAALGKAQKEGTALRLPDSDGLRLDVQPTGAAWWRLRYRHAGKFDAVFLRVQLQIIAHPDLWQ